MAHLPLWTSLFDDINRFSFRSSPYYESPFSFTRHPSLLSLAHAVEPTLKLRTRDDRIDGTVSTVGKDGFRVCMDVQQFKPSELNVKVVDNCVVVEGKHEEREDDNGFISRHFVRRYVLPKDYDPNKVESTLSSDGVLTISVAKPQIEDKSNERQIHIQHVGPAHLNVKENPKIEENSQESSESEKAKE